MTRQEKYPDTKTFHYYNANPKNRITGDCWCRAISTATEIPYNTVVMEMAELHCKTGYDAMENISRYLESKGWAKCKQPKRLDGTKYTGDEFCRKLAMKGQRYVANIGGHHMVAIVDRRVYDIWNSTGGCIGNYWVKE